MGHHRVGSEHLLLALTQDPAAPVSGLTQATRFMAKYAAAPRKDVKQMVRSKNDSTGVFIGTLPFTEDADAVLDIARGTADGLGLPVSTGHLLLAIMDRPDVPAGIMLAVLCNLQVLRPRLVRSIDFWSKATAPEPPSGTSAFDFDSLDEDPRTGLASF